jgi:NAD(P)-dependent dehydrogenase (short-subunit alcohol dehydrogenase family)
MHDGIYRPRAEATNHTDTKIEGVRPMDRTIVVTGASSGLGLAAAKQFAAEGDRVVVVGRNGERLAEAVTQVRAAGDGREPGRFQADFEVLDDVRKLAAYLLETCPRIDVLANNGGGMVQHYRMTVDGFEATIQSNHLGPFLLTHLLRERLAGGRVVNTASDAHKRNNLNPEDLVGSPRGYSFWKAYGAGKAANILFTAEAARRWPEIFSVSFHPGVVRTNFGVGAPARFFYRYAPFLVTPEKAGEQLVWLATAPASELVDGGYYEGHKAVRPSGIAGDPAAAAKLWETSVKAIGW